jgi:hypothetical protein
MPLGLVQRLADETKARYSPRPPQLPVATDDDDHGAAVGATTTARMASPPPPALALLPPLAPLSGDDVGLPPTAHQHLRALVDQVLRRCNLRPDLWAETVLTLIHRACTTLKPDVRNGLYCLPLG